MKTIQMFFALSDSRMDVLLLVLMEVFVTMGSAIVHFLGVDLPVKDSDVPGIPSVRHTEFVKEEDHAYVKQNGQVQTAAKDNAHMNVPEMENVIQLPSFVLAMSLGEEMIALKP